MDARRAFLLIAGLFLAHLSACSGGESASSSSSASIVFRGCREQAATTTLNQPSRAFECAIYTGVVDEAPPRPASIGSEAARAIMLTGLTEFGVGGWSPRWSPDRDRIAFVSRGSAGSPMIVLVNADGSEPVQLGVPLDAIFQPFWSPDSDQIAFMGEQNDDIDIYVINDDGSNLRRLTSGPAFDSFLIQLLADFAFDPWAPDGQHLAFTRFEVDDPPPGSWATRADVLVLDIESNELRRVAERSTFMGWAPNNDWLLTFTTPDDSAIELVSPDGQKRRRLVDQLPDGFMPAFSAAWSPDSDRVAFAAWRDVEPSDAIYIADIDAPDAPYLVIAESCLARQGLAWSSNGEWLAFVTGCNLNPAIGFMRTDGSGLVTMEWLTRGELVGSSAPDWLP